MGKEVTIGSNPKDMNRRLIWFQIRGTLSKLYHQKLRGSFKKLGFCGEGAMLAKPTFVLRPDHLFLYDHAVIGEGARIMNTRANFIMKRYSGAAFGLSVVTGNHMTMVGKFNRQITNEIKDRLDVNHVYDKDIVVGEEVWLGCNVTLLNGASVGRGAFVGGGSVVRNAVPPYAKVIGNPARVVGFRFTPEQIIEHEKALYPEEERLPLELLEKNYKKYFLDRRMEIIKSLQL